MKRDGKKTLTSTKTSLRNPLALKRRISAAKRKRLMLGRYIVADSAICHGKPTFRGTLIMVWQVLEMVSEGMAWQSIVEEFGGSITKDAVAEAVQLASKSFIKHAREHALEPIPA
jgi:uncharacterized protein (DUF433 family)